MTKELSSSLEDYLEAVYSLAARGGSARASDISRLLKVSKPSVNSAVKALAARGLLQYEKYGLVRLTPAGLKAGGEVAGRHQVLRDFFVEILGMPAPSAERDACRAEHAVSRRALHGLARLTVFLRARGRQGLLRELRGAVADKD